MPSDRKAKWRVRIAFLFLFVVMMAVSVGAYYVPDLSKLQQSLAIRDKQAAVPAVTEATPLDEALRQHPQDKFLRMVAMAAKAANETNAAVEKLSAEIAPPSVSSNSNPGASSRSDLETLRRDLKTAESNATTFKPRYEAVLKAERDKIEKYALSLRAEKDVVSRFLDIVDKRHAETTAVISRMLSARADLYRAYENYVAFLVAEFGSYKVVDGHLIFPLQSTVNRYNAVANAMSVATSRVAELEATSKKLLQAQQDEWKRYAHRND